MFLLIGSYYYVSYICECTPISLKVIKQLSKKKILIKYFSTETKMFLFCIYKNYITLMSPHITRPYPAPLHTTLSCPTSHYTTLSPPRPTSHQLTRPTSHHALPHLSPHHTITHYPLPHPTILTPPTDHWARDKCTGSKAGKA